MDLLCSRLCDNCFIWQRHSRDFQWAGRRNVYSLKETRFGILSGKIKLLFQIFLSCLSFNLNIFQSPTCYIIIAEHFHKSSYNACLLVVSKNKM